jgi:hypothetical protein
MPIRHCQRNKKVEISTKNRTSAASINSHLLVGKQEVPRHSKALHALASTLHRPAEKSTTPPQASTGKTGALHHGFSTV